MNKLNCSVVCATIYLILFAFELFFCCCKEEKKFHLGESTREIKEARENTINTPNSAFTEQTIVVIASGAKKTHRLCEFIRLNNNFSMFMMYRTQLWCEWHDYQFASINKWLCNSVKGSTPFPPPELQLHIYYVLVACDTNNHCQSLESCTKIDKSTAINTSHRMGCSRNNNNNIMKIDWAQSSVCHADILA